jgi:hypothetical protein
VSAAAEPQRPPIADVTPSPLEQSPAVVDGAVLRVNKLAPYPQASTGLGGCLSFTGLYVTDPDEIAAIWRPVRWGR